MQIILTKTFDMSKVHITEYGFLLELVFTGD